MYSAQLRRFINMSLSVLLAIFLCLIMSGITFAYDEPCEDCEIPPYPQEIKAREPSSKPKKLNATSGKKVWTKQVNSGCSYSDHYITIDIDVKPERSEERRVGKECR